MNLIEALQQAVVQSLVNIFEAVLLWIPKLAGAFVVFIFGLLLSKVARDLFVLALNKIQLDRRLNRFDVNDVLKKVGINMTISESIAWGVYWIVLLAFIQSAVRLLGISFVTDFITIILTFIPELVAAMFVLLAGLVLAYYASRMVKNLVKAKYAPKAVEVFIILLTLIIAVDQLGVDVSLVNKVIVNVITGIVAALAIAFGFGGREKAKEMIDQYSKKNHGK